MHGLLRAAMLALRRNAHQIGGGHGVARLGNAQHAAATYAALTWQGPCACILCFCVFTRVGDRLGALRPVTFSWWGAMSTVRARTSLRSHATARRTRKAPAPAQKQHTQPAAAQPALFGPKLPAVKKAEGCSGIEPSRAVPHPSTNQALCRLNSEVGKEIRCM